VRGALLAMPLAAGCVGDGPVGVPTGAVELAVVARPPSDDDVSFGQLEVVLDELVIDGTGPSGFESVSVLVDSRFRPLRAADAVGFELEVGSHRGVEITARIAAIEGPGVFATGSIDDDLAFRLEVDAVELSFGAGTLQITEDEPVHGRIVLDPGRWLQILGLSDDDDEGLVVVGPGSGAAYDRLVQGIVDTSRLEVDAADDR
jgi:hypothetical protein